MQKLTFLIVDDDLDDIEMFQEALQKIDNNFEAVPAENGYKALQWLEVSNEKPDYIFLDLNMPPLNGFQTLKKLKESKEWKNIPVIVYTTSKLKEDKERCLEAGAFCCISKPNNFEGLIEIIQMVLKNEWQLL